MNGFGYLLKTIDQLKEMNCSVRILYMDADVRTIVRRYKVSRRPHPLAPRGTAFQQRVWAALRAIRYGERRTYGELAAAIGSPSASRAVGMGNHHNPIPIVIPCHRVIGSDRSLTGYGGGLAAKLWLLELESEPLLPFLDTFVK